MMKLIKSETGFTLIEVIAVLIILGILAAVAVPKYFDLAEEAKKTAFKSAISQGKSICSLAYSKASLIAGRNPTIAEVISQLNLDGDYLRDLEGDFKLKFVQAQKDGKDAIFITAEGSPNSPFPGDSSDTLFTDEEKSKFAYWIKPMGGETGTETNAVSQ